jgi:hypothetical protein
LLFLYTKPIDNQPGSVVLIKKASIGDQVPGALRQFHKGLVLLISGQLCERPSWVVHGLVGGKLGIAGK